MLLCNKSDRSFLFTLYSSTRTSELAAWGWNAQQQEDFLKMQFEGQQAFYQTHFWEGDDQIILCDRASISAIFTVSNKLEIRQRQNLVEVLLEGE